jgi:pimeloyl-ACP methyl ester carboxylesterase
MQLVHSLKFPIFSFKHKPNEYMSFSIPTYILQLVIKAVTGKVFEKVAGDKKESKKGPQIESYREEDKNDSVVLFLHGFTGDPVETFKNIPDLLIANELTDGYDVFSIGYSSSLMPDIGANIWSADPDINNLAEYFKTLLEVRFNNYKKILVVAHSMGGLVAQSGILKLENNEFKKITHLLMFGTPSGGLNVANFKILKRFKRQIRDLGSDSDFVKKLRADWKERFNSEYPFEFKVIAGLSDEFIDRESSIEVFEKRYRYQIEGNHATMIKANDNLDIQNPCYRLLLNDLSPINERFENENPFSLNQFIAKNKEIVDKLDDDIPALDYNGLKKLALAYDSLSEDEKAINALITHPLSESNSDIMGIIGGRFKRKYLFNGSKSDDATKAIEWYTKGYDLSKEKEDRKQIFYHAINLAFLSIVSSRDEESMKLYAQEALDNCDLNSTNIWEIATIAEANIYLDDDEKSKEYFTKVMNKTEDNIRVRSSIYLNAKFAYQALNDAEY